MGSFPALGAGSRKSKIFTEPRVGFPTKTCVGTNLDFAQGSKMGKMGQKCLDLRSAVYLGHLGKIGRLRPRDLAQFWGLFGGFGLPEPTCLEFLVKF